MTKPTDPAIEEIVQQIMKTGADIGDDGNLYWHPEKISKLLAQAFTDYGERVREDTLEKLHKIEEAKNIYDIHYCRAGIGFLFYEPPKGFETNLQHDDWKKYLTVDRYYDTFEKAVNAEYEKLLSTLPTKHHDRH